MISLGLGSAQTHAESAEAPFKVAFVNGNWLPFTYTENGQHKGFALELTQLIFAQLDIPITTIQAPIQKNNKDLLDGKIQAYVGVSKNSLRLEQYHFSEEPIFKDQTVLLGPTNRNFDFQGDVTVLAGYRIGKLAGSILGPAFDSVRSIEHLPVDPSQVIKPEFYDRLMPGGDMDFFAINARASITKILKDLSLSNKIKVYATPIDERTYYIAFSRKTHNIEHVIKRFNRLFSMLRSTRQYQRLLAKYEVPYN